MRFDSLALSWVLGEVNAALAHASVSAVSQPGRYHLAIAFRATPCALHLVWHPRQACLFLAEKPARASPPAPPVLNARLRDALLVRAEQCDFDRVALFRFASAGRDSEFSLVAELISGAANLLLLTGDNQVTWIAARRIGGATARRLRPGAAYLPPLPRAPQPISVPLSPEEAAAALSKEADPIRSLAALRQGLSPWLLEEAFAAAGVTISDVVTPATQAGALARINSLLAALPKAPPSREAAERYLSGSAPAGIFPPSRPTEHAPASAAVAAVLRSEQAEEHFQQAKRRLLGHLATALNRARRTLKQRQAELVQARKANEARLAAEMLLAQPDKAPLGSAKAVLEDLYHPGATIEVTLDPRLSPFANAERYFDRARKAESAAARLPALIANSEAEVRWLEEARDKASSATDEETLQQVERALRRRGLVAAGPAQPCARKKQPQPLKNVRRLADVGGFEVLLGANAQGNDAVLRLARPWDLWLHARGGGGAHAIIRTNRKPESVPHAVLEQVAVLAAYFSEQKHSELVPVDYTERRFVRRRKGAPAGHVLYERAKTIFVEPAEGPDLLRRLSPKGLLAE